jgi:hypothetical protein
MQLAVSLKKIVEPTFHSKFFQSYRSSCPTTGAFLDPLRMVFTAWLSL